jgi:hypothetical protein
MDLLAVAASAALSSPLLPRSPSTRTGSRSTTTPPGGRSATCSSRSGATSEHLFMSLRDVQKAGTRTTTSALLGLLRDDARTRQEFLSLARG